MDWSKVDEKMVREILRQGEIYLQNTLAIATASDQHAATLAGIFSASATVALGVTAAIATSNQLDIALIASGAAVAVTWFIGSMFCVSVVWPSKFQLPGNHPRNWWPGNVSLRPIVEARGGESENYQERIDFNEAAIRRSAIRLKWGAAIGCTAPFVGLLAWLIAKVI